MSSIDVSYRNIARVTAPVAVTQLSYTLMGVIDTMMVGRLGVLEVGAVGLGSMLTFWFLSFFFGTLIGVNTFVAQAYGAKAEARVGVVYWQGLYLAAAFALAIAAVLPLVDTVFGWTDAGPEMRAIAADYSRIRLWGALGFMLVVANDNFYRGLGRTDVPMWCALCQVVLNCGFNYLFIFGHLGFPAMGARGAALGTVVAQLLVGLALVASVLSSRRLRGEFAVHRASPPAPSVLRAMLLVSLPIGVQTFVEMGGITVFTALIAQLGAAEMAATNAVIQIWSMAFMICFSLAVAATTLVGQCLGAQRVEDVPGVVSRIQRAGIVMMAGATALYLGAPAWLTGLFVEGPEAPAVVAYARPLLVIVVVSLWFDLRFNVLAGAMRGAGATTYPMVVNIACAWLLFVPLVIWATPRYGVVGAWWCLAVYVAAMVVLLEARYRFGSWMRILVDGTGADIPPSAHVGAVFPTPKPVPAGSESGGTTSA